EQLAQVALDRARNVFGGLPREVGLTRAADEHGQGDMSGGRARGKKGGRKQDAEDGPAFDGGGQDAESIERMRDLISLVTEKKRRDRRMFDPVERRERPLTESAERQLR